MNEGHAVLALERIRILIQEEGLNFDEARQLVASRYLYNPHARASWDCLFSDKVLYLGQYADIFEAVEITLALGRENTGDLASPLSMVLALKDGDICQWCCPVHGVVSRKCFMV